LLYEFDHLLPYFLTYSEYPQFPTESEESLNAPDISKCKICDINLPATMVTLTDGVYSMVKDMETVDTQNKLESMVKDGQIHKATEDIKTEQNDNESTMISHTAQTDDVQMPSGLSMVEIIGASNSLITADDKQHELMQTDIKSLNKHYPLESPLLLADLYHKFYIC
jgi:hypothetical protein